MKSVRLDDTETKVEQAIKAAQAAGLTMTKIPTYEYPEVEVKEDMPTIHDRNLLEELNSDLFIQRSFTSSKSKKQNQNIVIDLDSETVKVPNSDIKVNKYDDTIINLDVSESNNLNICVIKMELCVVLFGRSMADSGSPTADGMMI